MSGRFDCDTCGREIGYRDSHIVLRDGSVTCMAHYRAHLDAGMVSTALTREQAVDWQLSLSRRVRR